MGTLLASIKVQVDLRENASFQLFIVIRVLAHALLHCATTIMRPGPLASHTLLRHIASLKP